MAFNWKSFLLSLAEVGPAAVEMALSIKGEVPTATKTQLATDSLHAATGVAEGLLSNDPADQANAQAAASIVQSYINVLTPTVAAASTSSAPKP